VALTKAKLWLVDDDADLIYLFCLFDVYRYCDEFDADGG